MLKRNVLALLSAAMICAITIGYTPAFAQNPSDSSGLPKHYLAQNDESETEEDESASEESGRTEETEQQSESTEESAAPTGPFTTLLSLLMGEGGSGQPVSLATLFVQYVGMGILIVFLVAIPISFSCVFCALIWKIGMVARGGKKPDIG